MFKDAPGGDGENLGRFTGSSTEASALFRLFFGGARFAGVLVVPFPACDLTASESTGEGALLVPCDVCRTFCTAPDALCSPYVLDVRGGKFWHINVPRFTPADSRKDLALGFRGEDGGGGGLSGNMSRGRSAESTFASRFEALTGGDDVGAGCLGVSQALTLGTGTLPRGIFGVCSGGLSNAMAGSASGLDAGFDF